MKIKSIVPSNKNIPLYCGLILIGLYILPIIIGFIGVILPAFHYMPVLGHYHFNWLSWAALFNTPSLLIMLLLTVCSAITSTMIALWVAFSVVVLYWDRDGISFVRRWLPPVMAMPHVALTFGLLFVLMPSGLLIRPFAWLLDWTSPPVWQTVQDPYGLTLVIVLVLKDIPFFIFMILAALTQLPVDSTLRVGGSLGFSPLVIWRKLLWPQLYPAIRFPVYMVLAHALSVVDIALLIGPTNPPPFAVQIFQWMEDNDLSYQLQAASGSILLLFIVVIVIAVWRVAEWLLLGYDKHSLLKGSRDDRYLCIQCGFFLWRGLQVLFIISLVCLLTWSFVWRWPFPSLLPDFSLISWQRCVSSLMTPLWHAFTIAFTTSLLAVILVVLLLELKKLTDSSYSGFGRLLNVVMYMPLLIPHISFLFGIHVALVQLHWSGYWLTVVGLQLFFVLPYGYLSLSGHWQSYYDGYTIQGLLLSQSPLKTFLQIKLKILWQPLMNTFALCVAVSVAQYLPTVIAGAGRIETITTEAVALGSGGNRRLLGVYGLSQMIIPLCGYIAALVIGCWKIQDGHLRKRVNI